MCNKKEAVDKLEGVELLCIRPLDEDFTTGKVYKIKKDAENHFGIVDDSGFVWYFVFHNASGYVTTINEVIKNCKKCRLAEFKLVEKPKSKITTNLKVKVDLLFDSPTEETTKDGKFIFIGRTTIFIANSGEHAYATCNSNELKSYSKLIGKSIAYYRAFNQ